MTPTDEPNAVSPRARPWPLIALAAWAVPWLGHALIGHARRGAVVGVTLVGLFLMGMVIGGIDVVDRRGDTLWFAGQAMIGPMAFVADELHRRLDERREDQIARYAQEHGLSRRDALTDMVRAGRPPAYRTSVGRVNEIGTLYCAIAGVMNLLAVLDAVGRAAHGAPAPAADPTPPNSGAAPRNRP